MKEKTLKRIKEFLEKNYFPYKIDNTKSIDIFPNMPTSELLTSLTILFKEFLIIEKEEGDTIYAYINFRRKYLRIH